MGIPEEEMKTLPVSPSLYWKLQHQSTPLPDRVKLVRYAWQHDSVYIPNKYQTLLDWLAATLAAKNRDTKADMFSVWRCFRDVLGSKTCQHFDKQGPAVVLKSSACQLLVEELQCHTQESNGSPRCEDRDIPVSCCLSLMSTTLGYTWAAKYDHLLHLLSTLCQLCGQVLDNGETPSEQILQLLAITVEKYRITQRKMAHPLEVLQYVSSGLLLSASRVITAQVDPDVFWSPQFTTIQTCLNGSLQSALLRKELQGKYELYLKLKVGKQDAAPTKNPGTLPKAIDNVFIQLDQALKQKQSSLRKSVLLFLPLFYRAYIQCYRAEENATGIQMFIYLCHLLGIDPESQSTTMDISEDVLEALHKLLEEVTSLDVYNPTCDLDLGGQQIAWLQKLGKWLLKKERPEVCKAWFQCLTCLLRLNHAAFDGQIPDLIKTAWLSVPQELPEEIYAYQGELLVELLDIYERLRQVHKLVAKLIVCLQSRSGCNELVWPEMFTERLKQCFTNLPQGVCADVWQNLNSSCVQHFLPKLEQGVEIDAAFTAVVEIFVQFLLNVQLADYSITQQTTARAEELMKAMATEHLLPLLTHVAEKDSPVTVPVLYLVWSWGELCLLLRRYGKLQDPSVCGQLSGAARDSDMSLVYPFCSPETWQKLWDKVKKTNNAAALFLLEKMCMQKVKAILVFERQIPVTMTTSMQNTTNFIFNLTTGTKAEHLNASWDGQVGHVNQHNHVVAHWSLICSHLPMALPYCDQDQLMALASYLLWTLTSPLQESKDQGKKLNLATISQDLLLEPEFHELKPLQSALVSTLWFHVAQIFKVEKSSKKRKSETAALSSCLEKLSLASLEWEEWKPPHEMDSDRAKGSDVDRILQDVAATLQDMLEDKTLKVLTQKQLAEADVYLKVLLTLPVEHFLPANSLGCMMGILLLAASSGWSQPVDSSKPRSQLIPTCLKLLILTLESGSAAALFQHMHSGILLLWFAHFNIRQLEEAKHKAKECYKEIVATLLRGAVKQETSLQQLGLYTMLITTELSHFASPPDMRMLETEHTLQHSAALLRFLARVIQKSYIKPEIKTKALEYFTKVADAFINAFKPAFRLRHQVAVVLAGCSMILEAGCALSKNDQDAPWWQNMLLVLPIVCLQCKELLADKDELLVLDRLQQATQFINKVCQWRIQLKEHIPANFVCDMFNYLLEKGQQIDSCSSERRVQISQNVLVLPKAIHKDTFVGKIVKSIEIVHGGSSSTRTKQNNQIHDHTANQMEVDSSGQDKHCSANQGTGTSGSYKEDGWKCVQQTAAHLLGSMELENFQKTLHRVLGNVDVMLLDTDPAAIRTSLLLWQQLLEQPLEEEPAQLLVFYAQNILPRLQNMMLVCSTSTRWQHYTGVILVVLQTQTKMLSYGPSLLSPQSVGLCLQSCAHAPLSGMTPPLFAKMFQGVFNVVDEMLVKHPDAVVNFLPPYVSAVKRLLLSLIQEGDQNKKLSVDGMELLVDCALQMDKLGSLIAGYKTDFAKLATYIIADYVIEVQKVTLIPNVKKVLLSFVHQVLSICDHHSIAQLHVVLPSNVRSIFKTIFDEYVKYYRYTGKV